MASTAVDNEIYMISKGLYRIVSDVVGPECIVKLRRQRLELGDLLENCETFLKEKRITSGSMGEGFMFKSSDIDRMYANKATSVCTDSNRLYVQMISTFLFIMENDLCSPGFTLIRCLTCDRNNITLYNSFERKGDKKYLSSKVIREKFMSSTISETHGPCQSDTFYGKERDSVYALKYPVWPAEATPFVIRSVERGWPSYDVLRDICNDGCLFVPINSKQQTCRELMDLEWRMSFSLAEKRLISSMNHCQFVCYGLTKLFLNEVVKTYPPIKDLLCSYFMKTAVFWEISARPLHWSIETFLLKFWNVFRFLIRWVRDGYCPNFFMPENNMFYGKICGENQRLLLTVLSDLYSDGYLCLLRCSSLNEKLTTITTQPYVANMFSYNEEDYVPVCDIEKLKWWVILKFDGFVANDDLDILLNLLNRTVNIKIHSGLMMCAVKLKVNFILQKYAESLLMSVPTPFLSTIRNRKKYHSRKTAQAILLRARTYVCMNYLYYAYCTYISGTYKKTVCMLHFIKIRLMSQPCIRYDNLDLNFVLAMRQQGMPYDTLLNSYIIGDMKIDSFTAIEELKLECQAQANYRGSDVLHIHPLVLINFLLILCYTRLGDYGRRFDILEELHTLLYHGTGPRFGVSPTAISLEILGICEQLCGHPHSAFQSYYNALNNRYNNFKDATIFRIHSLNLH